jgi:membrane associated rhomboid family serine protease
VIIPIGTDRPLARPTLVTIALIVANVAVYTAQQSLGRADPEQVEKLMRLLALDPREFQWWGLFSYAFLHGGLWHLVGNMAFLWVFGPNVEDRFGRIGFLVFYLAGGAAAGGLHALFVPNAVIGASGAIAAVTGAYLVLFPRTEIKTLFLIFFGMYNIPAWWFIGGRIAWDLYSTSGGWSGNVATGAHLAGYAFGAAVGMVLLWTKILPREVYDLFSISKQAVRRRAFRELQYQQKKKAEAKTTAMDDPRREELAVARAEVMEKLSAADGPAAGAAYRKLLEEFGEAAALLNRKAQYDIANLLYQAGDHLNAAAAYRGFLKGYPTDSEVPMVRLMIGLINARYLNDPVQAKLELTAAIDALPNGREKELARELMAELG